MRKRIKFWWFPIIWATWIFLTSCTVIHGKQFIHSVVASSGGKMTQSQFEHFWKNWWWLFVKGYHMLEYFILTCLIAIPVLARVKPIKGILVSAALALVYASSDEWHQTFVPTRGGKWTDVVIDSGGIVLAIVVLCLFANKWHISKQHEMSIQ